MSHNILLIEPDQILAKTYFQSIEKLGFKVTHTTGAQSAIYSMDQQTPDLVILEMQLIKHSGVEFLYEMRSYKEWQKIPVLLHSFIPVQKIHKLQDSLSQLSVSGYLYKPQTSLSQLNNMILSLVSVKELNYKV